MSNDLVAGLGGILIGNLIVASAIFWTWFIKLMRK